MSKPRSEPLITSYSSPLERITFEFDGEKFFGLEGDSLAAALSVSYTHLRAHET